MRGSVMSRLQDVCDALHAIDGDILQMAQQLHAKAQAYNRAAANAAAAARSAEGRGAEALARTAAAFSAAARHCSLAAQSLTAASRDGEAYVQRTVGASGATGTWGSESAGEGRRTDGSSPMTAEDIRSWLPSVNPGFTGSPFDPRSANCGGCALAVFKRLSGESPSSYRAASRERKDR